LLGSVRSGMLELAMIEATGSTAVISIIDDDASIRVAIESFLRSLGFDARSFESADQYLRSPERHHTSCIVSDVQLPGCSGLDLQDHLISHHDRTPIIFITAYPRPETRQRALNTGAIGFLTKPFDNEMLLNCIETALKSGREDGSST
jgi:FixJ family two-component response regulator